jgi:hypothetical protein
MSRHVKHVDYLCPVLLGLLRHLLFFRMFFHHTSHSTIPTHCQPYLHSQCLNLLEGRIDQQRRKQSLRFGRYKFALPFRQRRKARTFQTLDACLTMDEAIFQPLGREVPLPHLDNETFCKYDVVT